ncbi:MAG: hypothetical protein JNN06_16095 [Gemmobacter sp.]|uniref:hypothetical protein n=1 Tax=Gemmobacter sp. TaxID=1898957 RepID=UPI001A5071E4|nr:hypothetical protein [Gemmobacter sp.]MBL8563792.1 hypothetical protein [Gemmobacter sp.]
MLRETLTALRALGLLRLMLACALNVAANIAPGYLTQSFDVLWLAAAAITGYFISHAVPTGQPLFSTEISLRRIGRYALANLWVYGLTVLALLPGLVAAVSLLATGMVTLIETLVPLVFGVVLPVAGILALFGTALPAAIMGAPYGPRAALTDTRGQRWPLFKALLLGQGLITTLSLVLLTIALGGMIGHLPALLVGALEGLLFALSVIFTATLLAVAWRRRHPPAPLAEVFA